MSTFTRDIKMMALRRERKGLWAAFMRLLPPGFSRQTWAVAERFEYAVGSLENPSRIIIVPEGFEFDGASVPMILWPLFPMAHPDYIQAAALHDYLYQLGEDRREADLIFRQALGVLGMAAHWRWAFFIAVRIGGAFWWHIKKRKGA